MTYRDYDSNDVPRAIAREDAKLFESPIRFTRLSKALAWTAGLSAAGGICWAVVANAQNEYSGPKTCETATITTGGNTTEAVNNALGQLGATLSSIDVHDAALEAHSEILSNSGNTFVLPGDKVRICVDETKEHVVDVQGIS